MADLPEKMRGLRLRHGGYGQHPSGQRLEDLEPFVEFADMAVPEVGPGQVLVRVARAAVNPSDVAYIKGMYGQAREKGAAAGFEGCGTVVRGPDVLLGKRVSFFGPGGAWAEYAQADAGTVIPLRDDVSDEDAAGLVVNPITACAMFELVRSRGAKAFVATAGGSQLGKFLVRLGAEMAVPCLAVVRRSAQRPALETLGAGAVLVTQGESFASEMAAAFERLSPGVLLDAVSDDVSAQLFFGMPKGAAWVVYGRLSPEGPRLDQMAQFIFQGKTIEGFWLAKWFGETPAAEKARVIGEVQARFADGRWATDITEVVPLDQAMARLPEAYGAKDGKVVIAP